MLSRITVHLDHEWAERLKNAAHGMGYHSVADFLQITLVVQVGGLEHQFNNGEPFPPRPTLTQKIGGAA